MAEKKKKGKPHPRKLHKLYVKAGEKLDKKGKICPKCGNAVFMAIHKDRQHCGNCGYTEFQKGKAKETKIIEQREQLEKQFVAETAKLEEEEEV